jgi:hypothetical protein
LLAFDYALLCQKRIDLVAPDTDILQEVIIHGVKQGACGPVFALLAQKIQD